MHTSNTTNNETSTRAHNDYVTSQHHDRPSRVTNLALQAEKTATPVPALLVESKGKGLSSREFQRQRDMACSTVPLEEVGLDGVDHLAELACKARGEVSKRLQRLAATRGERDNDEMQHEGC